MTTRLIGARVRRNEDNRLLQGRGCFVDDVNPRGVLHAAGVRSPHACARIVRIDATRARALPGVHLVLTASDLGDLNEPGPLLIPHPGLTHPRTQRPLAVDRVRYVGELVAFVVAEDRYLAEDAVDLIEVEYEGGPAVIDLEHALDPAAPRVHEDVPGNRASCRPSATSRTRSGAPRASYLSGSRSSGAAEARPRRGASSPSGTRAAAPSGCGARRRRRFP